MDDTEYNTKYNVIQGCTNPENQDAQATKFCTVAPDICGTLLAPRILRWLLDFWTICAPLI